MKNRLPNITIKKKVRIICEGAEEYDYINKLLEFNIWNSIYEFIPVNAESNTKIAATYSFDYMNDSYDIVLIFCDTDGTPYESYKTIKQKIDEIHGIEGSANNVLIFSNPCTMQIILMHFSNILLCSHKKEDNRAIIKELTGIGSYDAKEKQRIRLFQLINNENYFIMKENISQLSSDDAVLNSTNFDKYVEYFENTSVEWIDKLNKLIECE